MTVHVNWSSFPCFWWLSVHMILNFSCSILTLSVLWESEETGFINLELSNKTAQLLSFSTEGGFYTGIFAAFLFLHEVGLAGMATFSVESRLLNKACNRQMGLHWSAIWLVLFPPGVTFSAWGPTVLHLERSPVCAILGGTSFSSMDTKVGKQWKYFSFTKVCGRLGEIKDLSSC